MNIKVESLFHLTLVILFAEKVTAREPRKGRGPREHTHKRGRISLSLISMQRISLSLPKMSIHGHAQKEDLLLLLERSK